MKWLFRTGLPGPRPNSLPKPALYETISSLNRDLGLVVEDLHRLREFRLRGMCIEAFIVKVEDLRAWVNSEFLEHQLDHELKDWFHFSRLDRKFEERYKDPDDVLIEAEQRRAQLAAEKRDSLTKPARIRKKPVAMKAPYRNGQRGKLNGHGASHDLGVLSTT